MNNYYKLLVILLIFSPLLAMETIREKLGYGKKTATPPKAEITYPELEKIKQEFYVAQKALETAPATGSGYNAVVKQLGDVKEKLNKLIAKRQELVLAGNDGAAAGEFRQATIFKTRIADPIFKRNGLKD